MKATRIGSKILEIDEAKNVFVKEYLIDSLERTGRCDIAGLALALGVSMEAVKKQYATLLRALEDRELF
jgi:hypothetical protein